ncbi:MAG: hypothetical protein NTW04_00445, partial [Elusimicrobia bacterium]|nr:hypothetical protein [Elusimicrobiota bacterium]
VIDRGAYSMQANSLLARLQKEAKSYGGKVVRIAGNHEIELLRGDFFMTTLSREEAVKYRLQIVRDILDGNITAAYAEQGYLFTHAGVTSKLMEILADEFRIKTPDE